MSLNACLIVMVGGALGTLLRYVVSVLALPISRELPWGTIIINVTGSLVIGLFGTLTLASGRFPAPENVRLFVMVGLCGGYTTFRKDIETAVAEAGRIGPQHLRSDGVFFVPSVKQMQNEVVDVFRSQLRYV